MKKKEMKENLKIDLFSFEREKISAQAMGNLLGGFGALCLCKEYDDNWDDTNRQIM